MALCGSIRWQGRGVTDTYDRLHVKKESGKPLSFAEQSVYEMTERFGIKAKNVAGIEGKKPEAKPDAKKEEKQAEDAKAGKPVEGEKAEKDGKKEPEKKK